MLAMGHSFSGICEETCGFYDYVHSQAIPWDSRWLALGKNHDFLAVDYKVIFLARNMAGESSVCRIVVKEMGVRSRVGEVVYGDNVYLIGMAGEDGALSKAANSTEPVY